MTYLDELKQLLEWAKLDHIADAAAICHWRREYLQISDVCFVYWLLQYFPNAVINRVQMWRIWRPQEVGYILEFLSVTTQSQHVCNVHLKFQKVV